MARSSPLRRLLAGLALCLLAVAYAAPAAADEYDARRAGHPLRIVAYLIHPFGVALDYLIFRPAHWAGSQPAMAVIFGHDVNEEPQR
jgi:hypothetical protein